MFPLSGAAGISPSVILVTGATGAIGPSVVRGLSDAGYRVFTFSLDPARTGSLPEGVKTFIGDVTDTIAVESAMCGVDIVIHLAALLHILNPGPEMQAQYERINVGGTAAVVAAAARAGVRRVVFFSTIAVYGDSRGQVLNEDVPACPNTYYAKTKLAAEEIVLGARRSDGQPIGTALRLGAVYGSRIKGNYRRLLDLLARRRFVAVGDGRNRRTLVYDRDVARAAVLAMDHPAAAGRVYNVTDGKVHTMNEIVETMCDALGRTPPRFRLPVGPVRLVAGVLEDAVGLLGRKSPIGRTAIDKYTEDVAVEGRRIQDELGFRPQYDLAAGWREAIQEMKQVAEL
jgi:UDP-glucose 4-epimerase